MTRWKIILCAAVLPILIHVYLYLMYSEKAFYDQLTLGQSVEEVQKIFPYQSVVCGDNTFSSRSYPAGSFACFFRDPWREYRLAFAEGRVSSKSVTHLRPYSMLGRIIRRISDWRLPHNSS
jgi:hypothetical protein